jgi:signal transduction histidine kinase
MKNIVGSISNAGTRRHLDASVALVSIIPFLTLALIGQVSFNMEILTSWQWMMIAIGVIASPILGYSLLLKYPATVMRLKIYLDDIVKGEIPDQINLIGHELDIVAIEHAMNLVLERLKNRAEDAEAVTSRLEEELLQSRKLEAIGTLATGIAHEINTPLQFIAANLTFITSELETKSKEIDVDEITACLSESREGVRNIANTVKAMSVFAQRGEEGVIKATNINEAIKSVVEVSRNAWKYVARCKMDLAQLLPDVTCQPGEIKQVFMNIMINAVDAITLKRDSEKITALGEIHISTSSDDDSVVIKISDTGCGMQPEIQNRIFEPFFTTDITRRHHGQGLTAAYASIVKKHGGNLTFESYIESGSTFCIQIPVCPKIINQKGAEHETRK